MTRTRAKLTTVVGVLTFTAITSIALAAIISRTADFEDIEPNEDPQQGWTFGVAPQNERIATNGDNHYLQAEIDSWGVTLQSKDDGTNPWVGAKNYRDEGVVGFEFTLAGTADGNTARTFTIFLLHDNGTPDDHFDDYGYYHTINKWYRFQGQPRKFQFLIPSWVEGDDPPENWIPYAVDDSIPDDITWEKIITHVDRLDVGLWRPGFFYIIQFHYMAVDNIKVYIDTEQRK